MGTAIGERLLGSGFPLTVYNRTEAKVAPLVSSGARLARSLSHIASVSDIVLTVLTDDAAVDSVYTEMLGTEPRRDLAQANPADDHRDDLARANPDDDHRDDLARANSADDHRGG